MLDASIFTPLNRKWTLTGPQTTKQMSHGFDQISSKPDYKDGIGIGSDSVNKSQQNCKVRRFQLK